MGICIARAFAALVLVAPALAAQAPSVTTGEVVHAAGTRRYRLFQPDTTPSGRRALVVMLHGCAQSAEELARLSRMDDAALRGGFAVLYPEQASAANPLRCWNWFVPEHQRRDSGEPAIIAAMIRKLVVERNLDSTRVHLVGISAGGAMAATIAVAYPELAAGLALHSTVPYRSAGSVARAMSVMRGDLGDEAALAQIAGLVAADMGVRRRDIPVIVLHGTVDPVVNVRNGETTLAQWRQSNHGAPAELRRVEGLAHAWSGGTAGERFADPKSLDATALFVDFFVKHAALGAPARGK